MHKRLDWQDSLTNLLKFIIALWILKAILSYLFPILLLTYGENYRRNLYIYLINNSTNIFSAYDIEDDEKINSTSVLLKQITGVDINDPKSILALEIPLLNQIDRQILLSKEDGPVIVIPKIQEEEETDDEEEIEEQGSSTSETSNANKENVKEIKEIKENETKTPVKRKLDPRKPLVLIYHTHTTESYNPSGNGENFTTDSKNNLIRVGQELKKELEEKYGIATLHDTTYHDIPKREGAYNKSRPTIQKYLKKYNSFQIIIDLHRDANVTREKSTALIRDKSYARVMFVVDTLNKNHTKNNITASKINDKLDLLYPGFSRGIMYKQSKIHYNQDLSSKIVLIEVGSNENSLEEAINTAQILARAIAESID